MVVPEVDIYWQKKEYFNFKLCFNGLLSHGKQRRKTNFLYFIFQPDLSIIKVAGINMS